MGILPVILCFEYTGRMPVLPLRMSNSVSEDRDGPPSFNFTLLFAA